MDKITRVCTRCWKSSSSSFSLSKKKKNILRGNKRVHWHNARCQFSRAGLGAIRSSKWIHGHRIIGIVHSGDRNWISRGFKTHRQPANPLIWPVSDRVVSHQSPWPRYPKTSISRDPIHTHARGGSSLSMVNVWFANKLSLAEFMPPSRTHDFDFLRFDPVLTRSQRGRVESSKPSNTLHYAILIYVHICVVYIGLDLFGRFARWFWMEWWAQRICNNGISLSQKFQLIYILSGIDEWI